MMKRPILLGFLGLAAACSAGCAEDLARDRSVEVELDVDWKDDPGTIDEIGYSVLADVRWPERREACFDLPEDLSLVVNDRASKPVRAVGCRFNVLVAFDGFVVDEPITVRLLQGHREIAHVTKNRPFERFDARLVSPLSPILHRGEELTIALPSRPAMDIPEAYLRYYWLPPPEGVPPYYSPSLATLDLASLLLQSRVPDQLGRAYIIDPLGPPPVWSQAVDDCVGFDRCEFQQSSGAYGPIAVEIVP